MRHWVKSLEIEMGHRPSERAGAVTASAEYCVTGTAMRLDKPALESLNDPKLKALQEELREPFAAIEKALLPVDRPLTEAERRLLRIPLGVDPK